MVTLFGTTYYTIGTGLVVLVLLAPLLWGFSRWALRPNVEDKPRRTRLLAEGGLTFGLLLLAAVGLYWDVYLIGQRAKELCAETGLFIYRQEPVEGFTGSTAISEWSKHGFQFVETDYFGTKHRYQLADGVPTKTRIEKLTSKYKLDLINDPVLTSRHDVNNSVVRRGAKVTSIDGTEILGELIEFTIHHGWVDRTLIALTGFVANPKTCGRDQDGKVNLGDHRLALQDLILATLKPK